MKLHTAPYLQQAHSWPSAGQHILAQYDETSVVVYQAYRAAIGEYAIRHGRLDGPDFSLQRMSWIKPNFLWMMYRSGWGQKEGQEVVLGLRISRQFFDAVLHAAVPSSWDPQRYPSREEWHAAVAQSEVDALIKVLPRMTYPALTTQELTAMNLPDMLSLAAKVIGFLSPASAE